MGNHNSLDNVSAFFGELANVVRAAHPPRELWSDLEAFAIPAPPPPPGFPEMAEGVSPWTRIAAQLAVERPLVAGFTTWEWHKYFSPVGGPQLPFDYNRRTPAAATFNSNASLHNYMELLRHQHGRGNAPPLHRVSLHAHYTLDPPPLASPGLLTDGLPTWNMGGRLPGLQVEWAGTAVIHITVTLPSPSVPVCAAKLFALASESTGVQLPSAASVTFGDGETPLPLSPTTVHNDAVNVFYMVLSESACVANATSATFVVHPSEGTKVAVVEVELYTESAMMHW